MIWWYLPRLYFHNLSNYEKARNKRLSSYFYQDKNYLIGFALYSRPIFLESLFSKVWMWSFQVRFSSTIILKNFIDVVLLISKLFIFRIGSFRGKLSLSQDLWKKVNFVLLSIKGSLFAWNQIAIFSDLMFAVWKKF